MPRTVLLFLLLYITKSISAQQRLLRIDILQGTNKAFVGDAGERKHLGYSAGYGVSYFYRKKKAVISFEPQIMVSINRYIFHINEDCDLHIRHRLLSFMPMAGIPLTKNTTFKTGVLINTSEVTIMTLVYNQGSRTKVGINNFNYFPNRIQAGFMVGVSTSLGPRKLWNFNLLLQQFANGIIDKDMELHGLSFKQPYNRIFSRKCKPTVILLGLSFVIKKFEREKVSME